MKKFQFKLQKLLDLRFVREREVEMRLAKVIAAQNVHVQKKNDMLQKIEAQRLYLTGKMQSGKFSYMEAMQAERYIDYAEKVVAFSKQMIAEMEPAVNKVRAELIEAQKQRKIVEKLKEKSYEEYLYEYQQAEAKEMDDANQKLYIRQQQIIKESSIA